MLAVVAAYECSPEGESEALQGIGRAFFEALQEGGSRGVILVLVLLLVALVSASIRFFRHEASRERDERDDLEERRSRAMATQAPARVERRAWVRVPGHLAMTVVRDTGPRVRFDMFETQNVGAGGIAYLTRHPPPIGHRVEFALDLGERTGLALSGVVIRVEPSTTANAPALVALRLGDIDNRAREHLMKWVAEEEVRVIGDARRGRTCGKCGRPLADPSAEMHSTCITDQTHSLPAGRAVSLGPRPSIRRSRSSNGR